MRRNCPAWFQDRLAQVGGMNPHGEPRFKLVWGESETMRDGGYFVKDGFQGYRDVPSIGGEACWVLMMWEPASTFGGTYRWYKDHTDEYSGLVTLGQYPFKGRYRVVKKLIHREFIGGQLVTVRMEPTHFILDVMVPLVIGWNKLSNANRLSIIKDEMAREEAEQDRIMADSLHDKRIRRDSPVVQKRLELMERTMSQAMAIAANTQRGMAQLGA